MNVILKAVKDIVASVHYKYEERKYTRLLKARIGHEHFIRSESLTSIKHSVLAISMYMLPQEFQQLLVDEFGKAEPYLPITYRKMRLDRYNGVVTVKGCTFPWSDTYSKRIVTRTRNGEVSK